MNAASRRYLLRFGLAMGAYVVLLLAGMALAQFAGDSPWRFAAMALPVPAILGIVWAVARYGVEADEMQSADLARSLAIAFGAGSALTFTYGIMQVVGAPPMNWVFVWVVYAVCWLVAGAYVRLGRR